MARESKTQRIDRTANIIATLRKTFPNARTALNYSSPLELLVATILSAQCTDKRVNIVTKDLFRKYRTPEDYAKARQATLENQIRSTGFYRNKAKSIRESCAKILADFDGKVPRTMDEMLALPGVARKTANVVLGSAFGVNEGIAVDTHVKRLAGRLRLSRHKLPHKIERDLMDLAPRKDWAMFSHLLIWHGRTYCTARKPNCTDCPVSDLCPSAGEV